MAPIKAQIAGLPLPFYRKIRSSLDQWALSLRPGVEIRACPSLSPTFPQMNDAELNAVKANVLDGYVHIAMFPCRDWERLRDALRFDCRVFVLKNLRYIPTPSWEELKLDIEKFLDYEERWCKIARPPDWNHPLLLPPPCFEESKEVEDFWSKCDVYWDTSKLNQANNTLAAVRSRHRGKLAGAKYAWADVKGKVFTVDPSRHALSPMERMGLIRYRFCYGVPPGFHYDVIHKSQQHFTIRDQYGESRTLNRANIDPWGNVR